MDGKRQTRAQLLSVLRICLRTFFVVLVIVLGVSSSAASMRHYVDVALARSAPVPIASATVIPFHRNESGSVASANPVATDVTPSFSFYVNDGHGLKSSRAGLIAATQSAVAITDTLHNPINVKVYGAVGDGVTPDNTAIMSAIAAAAAQGGGVVYVPSGTYLIAPPATATAAITLPSNVALVGAGRGISVLKFGANARNASWIVGSTSAVTRVLIRDLTVDGNRAQNANGVFGIQFTTATFCLLDNVEVTGTTSHGIVLQTMSTDNVVSHSVISNYGQSFGGFGILAFNGSVRNKIVQNYVASSLPNVGIAVDGSPDSGGGTPASDNLIHGNTVIGAATGILIEDSHRSVVSGNTLSGQLAFGIQVQPGQDHFVPLGTRIVQNIIHDTAPAPTIVGIYVKASETYVAGNFLYRLGNAHGIKLVALDTPPQLYSQLIDNTIDTLSGGNAILLEDGQGTQVRGNVLTNVSGASAINVVPVAAGRVRLVTIANNVIDTIGGTGSHGINVSSLKAPITDLRVFDNYIRNTGSASVGIQLDQAVNAMTRVLIRGNSVIDDRGSSASMQYGVSVVGVPTGVEIIDLIATGMTIAVVTPGQDRMKPGGPINVPGSSAIGTPARNLRGSVTIADESVSATVTLPVPEPDAMYFVLAIVNGSTGSPAPSAFSAYVPSSAQFADSFDVHLAGQPGMGNSITVHWLLLR